ncbi:hypothetical protein P8452_49966 [Trifolium repens]|nr:hypothetical protein P8452_49966 [Trifolium repens]
MVMVMVEYEAKENPQTFQWRGEASNDDLRKISLNGHYTERVAAAVVKTLVEVVQLCHKLGTELNHKPGLSPTK